MKQLLFLLVLAASLGAARAQIYFYDAELRLHSSRVRIEVDDLKNYGTNTTGKLRVVLFATEEDWDHTHHRKALAKYSVKRLEPGQYRNELHKTVHMRAPDDWGWHWLTVAVQERAPDETGKLIWITRHHFELDDPVYFSPRHPENTWPF